MTHTSDPETRLEATIEALLILASILRASDDVAWTKVREDLQTFGERPDAFYAAIGVVLDVCDLAGVDDQMALEWADTLHRDVGENEPELRCGEPLDHKPHLWNGYPIDPSWYRCPGMKVGSDERP